MSANLTAPQFTDEAAAIAHLEKSRWPDEVTCPHCGSVNVHRMAGKTQAGYFLCNDCRDKFTCRTGTVMERSHIPVHKWLLAIHLLSASKKGMSAHQLHRMLGVTYKSAWFLAHRIREAMRDGKPGPMGATGGSVQSDETYYGNTSKRAKGYKKGHRHKQSVMALVDEASGHVRAFHVKGMSVDKVCNILFTNVMRKATLVTDEAGIYKFAGTQYGDHQTVWHAAAEYVNKAGYTTNNVENFFGVFKKGMVGVYHFCSEKHLQRYLDEFSFRYCNRSGLGVSDVDRAALALKGIEGKRLTYRRPDQAQAEEIEIPF
jgi:transposase-like protein